MGKQAGEFLLFNPGLAELRQLVIGRLVILAFNGTAERIKGLGGRGTTDDDNGATGNYQHGEDNCQGNPESARAGHSRVSPAAHRQAARTAAAEVAHRAVVEEAGMAYRQAVEADMLAAAVHLRHNRRTKAVRPPLWADSQRYSPGREWHRWWALPGMRHLSRR